MLRASEEAKRRAVEVLEVMGEPVLDDAIPEIELRAEIFGRIPTEEKTTLVDGCRQLRTGDDGSHLGLTAHWCGYTREYSPSLLEKTPFRFAEQSALGHDVPHLRLVNREHRRKLGHDAPIDFLPPRWRRYVVDRNGSDEIELSRLHYELALLTTLNEQLKSGDVMVARSRRWADFEEYLIPRDAWAAEREQHYAALGLPIDGDIYLKQLEERLVSVTTGVDARGAPNPALTIDNSKGEYRLARLKANPEQDAVKKLKDLLESRMPEVELVEALIEVDNATRISCATFSRSAMAVVFRRPRNAAMCWLPWLRWAATSARRAWQPPQV